MVTLQLHQVLDTIQTYFEKQFSGRTFWCCAEVLQIKLHKQRVYIDLVEYDDGWSIIAKMKAIIWEQELLAVYLQAHGLQTPEELIGNKLLGEMSCWFHPQRWVSLHIRSLSHEFAVWQLHIQQQAIRDFLIKNGIYQQNQKTTFGLPPVHLAVISSSTSEWLRDFVTIITQSPRNISYELFEARIHGDQAREDVLKQLTKIATNAHEYSALIITRWWWGGEWLVRQNDRAIAAAICMLPIPVILATWHTSDKSLLDELVRHAAKTPSDAAHLILDGVEQTVRRLESLYQEVDHDITDRLEQYFERIRLWFEGVVNQEAALRSRMLERVEGRWSAITSLSPEQQLRRGYALVYDDHHHLISKKKLAKLQPWATLFVHIYDDTLEVEIKKVTRRTKT